MGGAWNFTLKSGTTREHYCDIHRDGLHYYGDGGGTPVWLNNDGDYEPFSYLECSCGAYVFVEAPHVYSVGRYFYSYDSIEPWSLWPISFGNLITFNVRKENIHYEAGTRLKTGYVHDIAFQKNPKVY